MKILLTGGTGLIGKEVEKKLIQKNHQVVLLKRSQFPSLREEDVKDIEAVIHLAGENVGAGRWTKERKKKIFESRVQLTKNLVRLFQKSEKLKVFISASAVGIYGSQGDQILTEESQQGQDFLADVCKNWEESLSGLSFGIRKVIFRTGMVLSPHGGALEKMILPFRFGLGGKLGNGKQWMSWIHLEDIAELYVQALEDTKFGGIYNAVSENPVTNEKFTEELAKVLGKAVGPSVPAIAMRLVLGEMSSLALSSQRVMPQRLKEQSYHWKYSDLSQALADSLASSKENASK